MAIFGWLCLFVLSSIMTWTGFAGAFYVASLGGRGEVAFPLLFGLLGLGGIYLVFAHSPFAGVAV